LPPNLLGGHVTDGSQNDTHLRVAVLVFRIVQLGQPEIQHLNQAVFLDDDIFGFDVAVDDTPTVGRLKCECGLFCNSQCLGRGDRFFGYQLTHSSAFDILHGDVQVVAAFAEFVYVSYVRVGDGRGGKCFLPEPGHAHFIFRKCGRQDLKCHRTPEAHVFRKEDRAHSAFAQQLLEPVRSEIGFLQQPLKIVVQQPGN